MVIRDSYRPIVDSYATNPELTKVASDVKLELSESEVFNGVPKYIG